MILNIDIDIKNWYIYKTPLKYTLILNIDEVWVRSLEKRRVWTLNPQLASIYGCSSSQNVMYNIDFWPIPTSPTFCLILHSF